MKLEFITKPLRQLQTFVSLRAGRLDRAYTAITILQKYNRIHNDLEAYLWEVAEWGSGIRKDKPNPKDYGVGE